MNDEELKNLWQQQIVRSPNLTGTQMIAAMQNKTTALRRQLHLRDSLELTACAICLVVFGLFAYREQAPVARVGYWIIMASLVFIAAKFLHTRHTTPPAPVGANIVDSLRAELNSVRAQSRLAASVLWWYLLPPGVGLVVAAWGSRIHFAVKIPITLLYVAIYWFIYWMNQRGRSLHFLPLEAQLQSLLHSAETGQPLDEAQAAALRPLALSVAGASHVTPAEFKVAFSQIFIIAEGSFVALWFFMVLSLNEAKLKGFSVPFAPTAAPSLTFMDYLSVIFSWQHLLWLVPFALGGYWFSKLLQKITERAVGISTVGIHLNRGMNFLPWDQIKEVRPLKVLYIRSLWLIRTSGEKMIMPWTSLERHADLKAAIESNAPPGHPIRKFLPLLKVPSP